MKTITRLILIFGCGIFLSTERNANAQSTTFNYTGSLQNWTVPCTSSITITAYGAQGGPANTNADLGGLGAEIRGTFTVVPGQLLTILVGAEGTSSGTDPGSGGGGGSAVIDTITPWIVAGGGGGRDFGGYAGADAVTTNNGQSGDGCCSYGGAGGTGGNDGNKVGYPSSVTGPSFAYGGRGFNSGGNGSSGQDGYSPTTTFTNGTWGLGGGGGGVGNGYCNCGGGGGGYSGGGSGGINGDGGGGGSYNIGSNQTNIGGVNSGNGYVTITWTGSAGISSVVANVLSNVSCNGGSTGSASETVTGGGTPYTYLWTPSAQTNATATGLSAGTYAIGVTDACGSTASASVTITQPNVLMASASTSSNVTCNAGSNGATASTVSGGTTPYTYSWTGGSTNTTATGLSAGTYTLNVRDMNGCTASASTVVTQPNVLSDTSFTTANVLCHGDSSGSTFTMVSGGTMPYTYLWTPGGGTTDTAVGLKAGSYTVNVSDACGASATSMVSITQPTALSITSHSTPDNGHGVGTAAVSVSGGMSPYTYLWSPGGNSTDSISGKAKGTYCCKVTDANGCIDSLCVVIKSTAGIEGITGNSGEIIVYPNPNNGQFTIESSVSGASTVEIYNILGEKVFTKNLSTTKGTNQINVSNQPNGVYLYRVISESGDLLGQGKITLQK